MPGVKWPRQSFTFEYKLKVIVRAAEIGNRAAAREFELDESMIRYWKKKKDVMTKLLAHLPYRPCKISSTGKNIERLGCEPERE